MMKTASPLSLAGMLLMALGFLVTIPAAIYFWLFVAFGKGLIGKAENIERSIQINNRFLLGIIICISAGGILMVIAKYTGL